MATVHPVGKVQVATVPPEPLEVTAHPVASHPVASRPVVMVHPVGNRLVATVRQGHPVAMVHQVPRTVRRCLSTADRHTARPVVSRRCQTSRSELRLG